MAKHPEFTPIKSAMMTGHHYDPTSRVLTVEFRPGSVYAYDDVPAEKVETMLGNKSVGGYFAAHIKPNHAVRKL